VPRGRAERCTLLRSSITSLNHSHSHISPLNSIHVPHQVCIMRGQPCRSYEGNDPNILLSYSTYHIVYIAHSFAAPTHAIMLVYEGVASEVVRSEGVAH
jgi:hypothetical protein